MDSCFTADTRCPVKFFNMRPLSSNHNTDDCSRRLLPEVRSATPNNSDFDRVVFRRPERRSPSIAAPTDTAATSRLLLTSVETSSGKSSTIDRLRADSTPRCRRVPAGDDVEDDKENATPAAGGRVVVTWLPPTGLKSTSSKTSNLSATDIGTTTRLQDEPNVSATTVHQKNIVDCQCQHDESLGSCGAYAEMGAVHALCPDDIGTSSAVSAVKFVDVDSELFPSSLNNISVISRGANSVEVSVDRDASAMDASGSPGVECRRLERSGRLSSSRRRLRRSPSSLNGAFCSSFNADEQAFCSTFCYPLHSTVVGFDVSELDISALVAEQLRHQQQPPQRKNSQVRSMQTSYDSAFEPSWCRLDSGASVWEIDENVATRKGFDDNLHEVEIDVTRQGTGRVEVTKTPENPLCTECGRFHSLVVVGPCPHPVVDLDSNDNEQSSTALLKRRRRDPSELTGEFSSTSPSRGTTELSRSSQFQRYAVPTAVDVEDSNSTDAADLTAGRMRRQMGLKKLYGGMGDDDKAIEDDDKIHFRLPSRRRRSDSFPDVTSTTVPVESEKNTSPACFCHRVGHRCIVCRQRPNVDSESSRLRRVPGDVATVETIRSRTTSTMTSISGTTADNVNHDESTCPWSSPNATTSIWSTTSTTAAMKFRSRCVDGNTPLPILSLRPLTMPTADRTSGDGDLFRPPYAEPFRVITGMTALFEARVPLPTHQRRRRNCPRPPRRCECSHGTDSRRISPSPTTRVRCTSDDIDQVLHADHQKCSGWRPRDAEDHRCSYRTGSASITSEVPSHRSHYHRCHGDHRIGVENRSVPLRKPSVDVTASWSTSTTSEQVHPSGSTFCRRDIVNEDDDSVVASRLRKRAVVRKLKRFSDALYGSAGGLQLKIFGHV